MTDNFLFMYPTKSFTQLWYLLRCWRWSALLISILYWHLRGISMVGNFRWLPLSQWRKKLAHAVLINFSVIEEIGFFVKIWYHGRWGLRNGQIITCEGRPHPFPASAPYLVGIDVVFNWPPRPYAGFNQCDILFYATFPWHLDWTGLEFNLHWNNPK